MSKALFPGNFDPLTFGHLSIIERASKIFDELDVVVAINPHKSSFFTEEERVELLKFYCAKYKNVKIASWHRLTVDYAQENNIKIVVRGLRPLSDFAYEFELAATNHQINDQIETLFLPTLAKYSVVRSSSLKEMARFGADLSELAPPKVVEKVLEKIKPIL